MASDTFTPIMYADDTTLLSTLDNDFNGNQITNPNSTQINAELTKVMEWLTVTRTRTRTLLTPKQKYISSKVQPFRENQKQIKSIIVHVT